VSRKITYNSNQNGYAILYIIHSNTTCSHRPLIIHRIIRKNVNSFVADKLHTCWIVAVVDSGFDLTGVGVGLCFWPILFLLNLVLKGIASEACKKGDNLAFRA